MNETRIEAPRNVLPDTGASIQTSEPKAPMDGIPTSQPAQHPGAANDGLPLVEWESAIIKAVKARYANPRTAAKNVKEVRSLFRFLRVRGAKTFKDVDCVLLSEWYWSAHLYRKRHHRRTKQSTARLRQWTSLVAFVEAKNLGAPIDPVELIGERISRPSDQISARPLTDEESEQVRTFADTGLTSRRSLQVAFSYAGGTATEVAAVRLADIDLQAGTVTFSGKAARTNPLDDWGREAVQRFIANSPPGAPDEPLCVNPKNDAAQAPHRVSVDLRQVLLDAGLSGREGVKASSIRLIAAYKVFEAEGIEAAARFLGTPSLDTAADSLGHDWRNDG